MTAAEVIVRLVGNTFGSGDEFAEELLGSLAGHGYVVVELPKPNCSTEDLEECETAAWIDLTNGSESVSVVDDEVALTENAGYYSPDEARTIAAALLAAADAAEESQ